MLYEKPSMSLSANSGPWTGLSPEPRYMYAGILARRAGDRSPRDLIGTGTLRGIYLGKAASPGALHLSYRGTRTPAGTLPRISLDCGEGGNRTRCGDACEACPVPYLSSPRGALSAELLAVARQDSDLRPPRCGCSSDRAAGRVSPDQEGLEPSAAHYDAALFPIELPATTWGGFPRRVLACDPGLSNDRTGLEPASAAVELTGIEPVAFSMPTRRATFCAIAPLGAIPRPGRLATTGQDGGWHHGS